MTLRSPRRGITLVEVCVVVAIVSVLAGLLLAAIAQVRNAALRASCLNNIRQLGLALHQYHDTHHSLPAGVRHPAAHPGVFPLYGPDDDPYPLMNWQTRLLPFLEQDALWRTVQIAYQADRYSLDNPPHLARNTLVPLFLCPADQPRRQAAPTSYLGVSGTSHLQAEGLLYLDSRIRFADVTDGLSQTLAVGERPPSADGAVGQWYPGWGNWITTNSTLGVRENGVYGYVDVCLPGPYHYAPGSLRDPCSIFHYWSLHPRGSHFLFADASARFLPYSAVTLLPALATRAGGEAASLE